MEIWPRASNTVAFPIKSPPTECTARLYIQPDHTGNSKSHERPSLEEQRTACLIDRNIKPSFRTWITSRDPKTQKISTNGESPPHNNSCRSLDHHFGKISGTRYRLAEQGKSGFKGPHMSPCMMDLISRSWRRNCQGSAVLWQARTVSTRDIGNNPSNCHAQQYYG